MIKSVKSLSGLFVALFALIGLCHAQADTKASIYEQTYIYAYPLVLMDATQSAMTRQSGSQESSQSNAPVNEITSIRSFPDANFKDVVRPNVDTLYSSGWFDLSKCALILKVPATNGRYYMLPMLDAWTNVFSVPGKRETGTNAGTFLITGPHWQGDVGTGMTQIKSPTDLVWMIGRIQTNGKSDYDAVRKIQDKITITPYANCQTTATASNETTDPKMAPPEQVAQMKPSLFLQKFAELLKNNPPSADDGKMVALLSQIGIVPGQSYSADAHQADQTDMATGFDQAKAVITKTAANLGEVVNGWHVIRENIGTYGTHYLQRAAVAFAGLGANKPEDAIYPMLATDSTNKPLKGDQRYRLHFDKKDLPPVNAFWSLTLYDDEGYLVNNKINRYALGDRDPLQYNSDGSLDILIQNQSPEQSQQANWLPSPAGTFNLALRLYWPKEAAINGDWEPPSIEQIK